MIEITEIFKDKFPENIITVANKILFLLHKNGMIKRSSFRVENVLLGSLRYQVILMISDDLLKEKNGFLSMTEGGLVKYSEAMAKKLQKTLNDKMVIDLFKKSNSQPMGSRYIAEKLLMDDAEKEKYRVQGILKRLIDNGVIVAFSNKGTERFYVLSTSKKGKEKIEDNAAVEIGYKNKLSYMFQIALPGTLTVGKKNYY